MVERLRGSAGVEQRDRIKQRDRGLCQACKREHRLTLGTQVDHIVSLDNEGTNEDDNLELLCAPCHVTKTRQDKGFRPRTAFDDGGNPIW